MPRKEDLATVTIEQVKVLCLRLQHKAEVLYKDSRETFNPNVTSPSHFERLAQAINLGEGLRGKVQPEWLRSLYYKYLKSGKERVRLDVRMLDGVSQFLGQRSWGDFEQTLAQESHQPFHDTYDIWWCGTKMASGEEPHVKYALTMTPVHASMCDKKSGKEIYRGDPPVFMGGNLYVELLQPEKYEKVLFVLHVGIAQQNNLALVSGILAGVNDQPRPIAAIVLLVRKDIENLNPKLVEEYFQRNTPPLMRAAMIGAMEKMQTDLELREKRLSGLFGFWLVYTRSRNTDRISVDKLLISGSRKIAFGSKSSQYEHGHLKVVGGTTLVLELESAERQTMVASSIGHLMNLETVNLLYCSFNSTGSHFPIAGLALMERRDSGPNALEAYQNFEPSAFDKDDPHFENIRRRKTDEGIENLLEEFVSHKLLFAKHSDSD